MTGGEREVGRGLVVEIDGERIRLILQQGAHRFDLAGLGAIMSGVLLSGLRALMFAP